LLYLSCSVISYIQIYDFRCNPDILIEAQQAKPAVSPVLGCNKPEYPIAPSAEPYLEIIHLPEKY
jgi:hypothetical protein